MHSIYKNKQPDITIWLLFHVKHLIKLNEYGKILLIGIGNILFKKVVNLSKKLLKKFQLKIQLLEKCEKNARKMREFRRNQKILPMDFFSHFGCLSLKANG